MCRRAEERIPASQPAVGQSRYDDHRVPVELCRSGDAAGQPATASSWPRTSGRRLVTEWDEHAGTGLVVFDGGRCELRATPEQLVLHVELKPGTDPRVAARPPRPHRGRRRSPSGPVRRARRAGRPLGPAGRQRGPRVRLYRRPARRPPDAALSPGLGTQPGTPATSPHERPPPVVPGPGDDGADLVGEQDGDPQLLRGRPVHPVAAVSTNPPTVRPPLRTGSRISSSVGSPWRSTSRSRSPLRTCPSGWTTARRCGATGAYRQPSSPSRPVSSEVDEGDQVGGVVVPGGDLLGGAQDTVEVAEPPARRRPAAGAPTAPARSPPATANRSRTSASTSSGFVTARVPYGWVRNRSKNTPPTAPPRGRTTGLRSTPPRRRGAPGPGRRRRR